MTLTALTGTPGTGKTSVGRLLQEGGLRVCFLDELAEACGALGEFDEERETREVDLVKLQRALPRERPLVVVGHYSHRLSPDLAIVLRCHPEVLRARLERRGWKAPKVQENVEAEAIGVIVQEAAQETGTFEVDTTRSSPKTSSLAVLRILEGKGEPYLAGKVDWSEVILDWY